MEIEIKSLAQAPPGWRVILKSGEERPILAWGLTVGGYIVPIVQLDKNSVGPSKGIYEIKGAGR